MRTWQRRSLKAIAAVIAAGIILLAVLIGVFRLFAPLVPGYRAEVERWAEHALQRPVHIAGMGARWDWYGPEITLRDVSLYARDGKYVVMTAHEIRLGVTLRALLHGEIATPSRITLIAPQFTVERDDEGHYSLRGFASATGQISHLDWKNALNTAFEQSAEIIVRDGRVDLLDARHATPYVFSNVDVKLDNRADRHRVSGSLALPDAFGHKLAFSVDIAGAALQPDTWQWHSKFDGEGLQLPALEFWWPGGLQRFDSGSVSMAAEFAGSGLQPARVSATFKAQDLQPAGVTARGIQALSGHVDWRSTDTGWELHGKNLKLTRPGSVWPESHFDLVFGQQGPSRTWQAAASYLDLKDVATVLGWLPTQTSPLLAALKRAAPEGQVSELAVKAAWQGSALTAWSARGGFHDLGMQSYGKLPGFSGLDGRLALSQNGGTLTLDTHKGSVTFPRLFRGPLYATGFHASVRFVHDAAGWHISSQDILASNADGKGQAQGSFLIPADGSSPRLDLDAVITNGDVRNKSVYFPVGIMPPEVVAWLDSAIVSGQVPRVTLSVHGRLADFPYDRGHGLFDIKFRIVNGVLDYATGWPKLEKLDADVEFRNQGLNVKVLGGRLLGDDVAGSRAGFADLRQGVLKIEGSARGQAKASLAFLRDGPLRDRFGRFLQSVKATGRSDVSLNLVLPVDKLDSYKLTGNAKLTGVNLHFADAPDWALSQLQGSIHFTGDSVTSDDLDGQFLGAPIAIRLHPGSGVDSGKTLFTATGGVQGAALETALGISVPDSFAGSTAWRASGSLPNDPNQENAGLILHAQSDLVGLACKLPLPFDKAAGTAMPFTLALAIRQEGLQLGLQYAAQASAQLHFISDAAGWTFDRGGLALGNAAASLPTAPGLSVTGKLDTLDLASWQAFLATSGAQANALPLPPDFLHSVDLHIGHFAGYSQHINALHLRLQRGTNAWQIQLASAAVGGQIALPLRQDASHPIIVALDHLIWQRDTAANTGTGAASSIDPRHIPPLRFSSKLLQFDGVSLSGVSAVLRPRPDGVTLADLELDNRNFTVAAHGNWVVLPGGAQHSHLEAQLDSRNIEATLKAFGYAPGITGSKGQLQANLDWNGSPLGHVVKSLNGTVHVRLDNGQLLEVQPGAGRLFGLLSINALPRRLLLNFSDVFGKGFGYDRIEGNFSLQNGNAYTRDLIIAGPAARIQVIGRIGLAAQDFDEALIVNASVGATLPIIGALAGGVGVGAVVWLLTEVFRKPLAAAGEIRYHLTGTWDNPKLEKVAESPRHQAPPPTAQPEPTPP